MEKKNGSGNLGRKIIRRISIAMFLCVLILPQTSWLILKLVSVNDAQIMEKLDYDLGENRKLADFPSGADIGNITSELEAYYNDHAPYRSILITINRQINSKLERAYTLNVQPVLVALADRSRSSSNTGGEPESSNEGMTEPENSTRLADGNNGDRNGNTTSGDAAAGKVPVNTGSISDNASDGTQSISGDVNNNGMSGGMEENTDAADKPGNGTAGSASGNTTAKREPDTNFGGQENNNAGDVDPTAAQPYFPAREMNGTIFGRDDWMFCNYDNSIGYYCGSNLMTEQQMKDRLSLMQKLQQLCDSRGVKLQFMIAPNKEQVYSEFMPTYTIENSYKKVPRFVDYVNQNSSVKIIYPIDELRSAKDTMSTYYKYDTHWNHYGSFIAVQALYKNMGLDYVSPDSVNYTEGSCIWGLVITAGLSWKDYDRDYDHIADYKPEIEFFNTDGVIDHIHTEKSAVYRTDSTASNQSRFVMVGDSFRLYMMPYLERDFAHVSVAHRDNIGDIQDDIRQADILVVECVERLDDSLNGTILQLIDILENQEKSN